MISWFQALWRRFFARALPSTGQTPDQLAELIRDLVVAMEAMRGPAAVKDQLFVSRNFSRALMGLLDLSKADQAAVLCKKAPVSARLPFSDLLAGLDDQKGVALAVACMRREDWSTSLRILDWALSRSKNDKARGKILNAAEKIARHILRLDPETFHAKVITLQLSPTLSEHVLASARRAG